MSQLFTSHDKQDLELMLSQCGPRFILKCFQNQLPAITDQSAWNARASSLLGAILFALCDKRDNGQALTADSISEYLSLEHVIELSKDESLSPASEKRLHLYLNALPGYRPNTKVIGDVSREQHAYLLVLLAPLFMDMID